MTHERCLFTIMLLRKAFKYEQKTTPGIEHQLRCFTGPCRFVWEYKQEWAGGLVLAVPPQNTSRTCPECGHVSADNRKTQAQFLCVSCGHSENADLVAAKNILAAGHAVSACGEMVQSDHSVKQEPAEGLRHVA